MRRNRSTPVFAALLLLWWGAIGMGPAFAQAGSKQPSLYKRMGGYDVIAAISDDVFSHAVADPQLGRFFKGHAVDTQKKQRQHAVDLLCAATGGPCFYTGRDMKTVHTGLGITGSDWTILMKYVAASLDKLKVGDGEKQEFTLIISGLKGDIVGH